MISVDKNPALTTTIVKHNNDVDRFIRNESNYLTLKNCNNDTTADLHTNIIKTTCIENATCVLLVLHSHRLH